MNQMRNLTKRIFSVVLLLTMTTIAMAQKIQGYVVDQQSGDSIPYANARYAGTKSGASSDESGRFTVERINGSTLTVTAVGYKPRKVKISEKTPDVLHVTLIADSKRMEEVVVKAKRRHRYSRKDNPAVELMRRVIAAKKRTQLENHDYLQYDKYQKLTMAVNNIKPEELESNFFKKSPWLLEQVEVCPYNQKLILPVSVDETLTQHIYRKNPKDQKDIIQGQSTKGISKLIQTGEMINTVVKDVFTDIDIYDDQIRLLQSQFPSPIGSTAISFYHFYIDDTTYVDKDQCIRLQFMPANQQDFGFRGELYVLNDSSLHVRKCDMQLPANTGVNFVDAMKIQQEYKQLDNGEWVLTTDNMVAELELTDLFQRAIVIRSTRLNNYSFAPIDNKLFKGKAKITMASDAKLRDENYWNQHRQVQLTGSEANMNGFIKKMSQSKDFKWVMFASKVLIENFIETGNEKHPSKFDIGPVLTFVSSNYIDGLRLRMAGRTTAKLNPHWFGEGYYAYGTKTHKSYYGAKVTYSFVKPEYHPIEFPSRYISFESTYDLMAPSDKFLKNHKDNVLMAIKPKKAKEYYFYNRQQLDFVWETNYGLTTEFQLKTESNEATGEMQFRRLNTGEIIKKIRTTDITLGFDYRPGQTYVNTKTTRMEVNMDAPEFRISHTMGLKHFLGGQYQSNYTELYIYKRLWLGSWGHIDTRLKGGAQWNKVPFPLLIFPPVNNSYFESPGTFNMMRDMEFLNDRFAQFSVAWDLNGKIFNRVPFLKRLKWREYVAFKGMWGKLTDKNNPYLPVNANRSDLFYLPDVTRVMTHDPYMELVLGVHNILKMFEVDYVRRLTYTNVPGIKRNGIRFGFNITF